MEKMNLEIQMIEIAQKLVITLDECDLLFEWLTAASAMGQARLAQSKNFRLRPSPNLGP